MDYEKLSDFEVNECIANIFGLKVSGEQFLSKKRKQSSCVLIDNQPGVDYCNNALDAWPIIIGNNICIENRRGKTALAWVGDDAPYPDSNPLRAAMIVFLMMNEGGE